MNKILMGKFEIKTVVDFKTEYTYYVYTELSYQKSSSYIVIASSYHYIYIN